MQKSDELGKGHLYLRGRPNRLNIRKIICIGVEIYFQLLDYLEHREIELKRRIELDNRRIFVRTNLFDNRCYIYTSHFGSL